jgi:hypothetical protein
LSEQLPDIRRGLGLLLQKTFTYADAVQEHKANILRQQRDVRQFWFFFDDESV